ncbi:MAG: exo-alpha-sialidase [Armatimonadota bacterium]|nr:MAG: exo-alpha-sialidase [Armatimonadota bacterium]
MKLLLVLALVVVTCCHAAAAAPLYETEFVLPEERFFNHAPCIIELSNGDLLTSWYHGLDGNKGEVIIEGARKLASSNAWSGRFTMADTPGYPDDNACMILDSQGRLWLFWVTLLANEWQSALLKYRISTDYQMPEGSPVWGWQEVLHVTPVDFEKQMKAGIERYLAAHPDLVEQFRTEVDEYTGRLLDRAADKVQQRIGWMPRAHPTLLPRPTAGEQARPPAGGQALGRLIVPLYTDAFSISVMAITDDGGKTWMTSNLIIGGGGIQPSVVRKSDGMLVAMMRSAGLEPRILVSKSRDDGLTWSMPTTTDLPNPGAGVEVTRLANGHWALVYNDAEKGRHTMAVAISDDEGETWKWQRHLEAVEAGRGYFAYPSIIQTRDGMMHVVYVFEMSAGRGIKHAAFNEEWVMEGD